MQDIYEKMGLFYLGKNETTLELYKSKDLTTHAMIIGMTGSGKTGLGISLIEEAAIDNIPAIVIDPKGDMANLCLAFENLSAEEFKPWVDRGEALTKNISIDELAEQKAKMWEEGLLNSHQSKERVKKFARVKKTIYTPGSSAGVSVNVLGSFDAPSPQTLQDSDTLISLINSTVSSLLSLISIEADAISSKEHLLLSNIFYHFYSKGISLNIEDIIGYVASPPFSKIGVFSLSSFYPQKERMKLAMLLNGIISSPTFSSWIEGEPLDIDTMLYDEEGRAKVAIFSIAHLNDKERMFFVTILLNSYINWMRKQQGSARLKAMLYMDEIFGFFPPVKNPPSKEPMLLLLKQARAFGVGVVLSTQNPIDIDYKALGNIGTWFVGKLQTSQDIARVIEPLLAKSTLSKEQLIQRLNTLKGREFFLQNVHTKETSNFSTRWVLSYLRGPMTKDDISRLMQERKKSHLHVSSESEQKSASKEGKKPLVNEKIKEYFHDSNINATTPFYPSIYCEAEVRFFNQRRSVDIVKPFVFEVQLHADDRVLSFENSQSMQKDNFTPKPKSDTLYADLPEFIKEMNSLKDVEKALSNYLYQEYKIELFVQKKLKMDSKLSQNKEEFRVLVNDRVGELYEEALEKLERRYRVKFERLDDKLIKLQQRLEKEENDVSAKTTDTLVDIGLAVMGAFFGRKTLSRTNVRRGASAFKKGRGVLKERNDVKNIEKLIEAIELDQEELRALFESDLEKIEQKYTPLEYPIESFFIKPRRSDITVKDCALLWQR
ncbi:ATP-binding protein [Sulfurimonas sp.]